MKIKDAISAGITLGVAFTGMSMLIGFMSDAIGPLAKAMLNTQESTYQSLTVVGQHYQQSHGLGHMHS